MFCAVCMQRYFLHVSGVCKEYKSFFLLLKSIVLSIKEMSGPGSSTGQEQQNRLKILEDLQQQKKRLQLQTGGQGVPLPSQARTKDSPSGPNRGSTDTRNFDQRQRQALQHAHTTSSAYFITQDSSFGNLILPVLPRVPAD